MLHAAIGSLESCVGGGRPDVHYNDGDTRLNHTAAMEVRDSITSLVCLSQVTLWKEEY